MPKTIDPEKHEADRRKFMGALYDIVTEYLGSNPHEGDPTEVFKKWRIIADCAQMSHQDADRIGSELTNDRLLTTDADDDGDITYQFTWDGWKLVEQERYERSLLGKRRRFGGWARGVAGKAIGKAAESAWVGLLALLGGLLGGLLAPDSIRDWIRSVLGLG